MTVSNTFDQGKGRVQFQGWRWWMKTESKTERHTERAEREKRERARAR